MRGFRCACDFGGNFRARAKAGIEQPLRLELLQCRSIGVEALRLAQHRLFLLQAQPREVLINRLLEFPTAAALIDIFDPQQKASAVPLRCIVGRERREGVAEMQLTGWTWRKPRDNHAGETTANGRHGTWKQDVERTTVAAGARTGNASCRSLSRLRCRRQRSHRSCATVAAVDADCGFRRAQRTGALRWCTDRVPMVPNFTPRSTCHEQWRGGGRCGSRGIP